MNEEIQSYLGYKPDFCLSDLLKREWVYVTDFAKTVDIGEEVVMLAAGPSLPKDAIWKSRPLPVFGLNRAADVHALDYWVATSDMLAAQPGLIGHLVSRIEEKTTLLVCDYGIEPTCNQERRDNVRVAAKLLSRIKNRIVLYNAIGMKSFKRIKDYDTAFRRGVVFGHRSVLTGAVELCRLFGVKTVHLFGHDARILNGERYCSQVCNDAITTAEFVRSLRRMIGGIEVAQNKLWNERIRVLNYCESSHNTFFERRSISEFTSCHE